MQSMASFVAQDARCRQSEARRAIHVHGNWHRTCLWLHCLCTRQANFLPVSVSPDPEVIQKGFEYLKGFAAETIVTAVLSQYDLGYFNGNNQTMWVMIQSLIQTLLVRLPLAYLMSIQPNASLTNIRSCRANYLCASGHAPSISRFISSGTESLKSVQTRKLSDQGIRLLYANPRYSFSRSGFHNNASENRNTMSLTQRHSLLNVIVLRNPRMLKKHRSVAGSQRLQRLRNIDNRTAPRQALRSPSI